MQKSIQYLTNDDNWSLLLILKIPLQIHFYQSQKFWIKEYKINHVLLLLFQDILSIFILDDCLKEPPFS
jgi:hypothetical protein